MPLSTYAELKSSIANWLNRDDLDAVIPDFITLAEARLNDRLRLAPMERVTAIGAGALVTSTYLVDEETGAILVDEETGEYLTDEEGDVLTTVALGTTALPADFLEMRMLVPTAYPQMSIKLLSPGWTNDTYGTIAGIPNGYTIIGSTLGVYPSTTAGLSMTYYARIPALSDAATTNWLLSRYPNMYLYASLLESAPLMQDDARTGMWKAALDIAISDATVSDIGTRWSNSRLTLSGPTP